LGKGSYLGGGTLIRLWDYSWFGTGRRTRSVGTKGAANSTAVQQPTKAKAPGAKPPKPAKAKKKPASVTNRPLDPVQEAGLALLRTADKPKAISRLEKVMLDRLKPQSAAPSPKKQPRLAVPMPTPAIDDDEPYGSVQALDRALDAALAMAGVAKQRAARPASSKPRNPTPREAKSAKLAAEARAEAARKQAQAIRREKALARAALPVKRAAASKDHVNDDPVEQ
jgi:hypothetical protein